MKPYEMVEGIKDKADLVRFVEALLDDFKSRSQEWENSTLESYLGALAAWIDDSDGYYQNLGLEVPINPSWRDIARMLGAATIYE